MNLSIEPNPKVPFKVRYADDEVLVVEKPARIVTQPGKGHEHDTLMNGLFAQYGAQLQNLGKDRDFGLLHRLDRATSGLVIVALRGRAYDGLRKAFEEREIRKFYYAICHGHPKSESGVIRKPILEAPEKAGKRGEAGMKLARISGAGKPAITAYRVVAKAKEFCLVECRAVTGRLHQIRVHLEAIHCPILGDEVYAPPAIAGQAGRLALHAHRVAFEHPTSGEAVDVRAPLPRDLRSIAKKRGLSVPATSGADQEADDGD
ncbi:MAG: RluA family pseudouridine synthase [Planctomycetes bacterium]|nr:RluA family pseudouridine synthase [Planctomycetota bacterium]